MTADQSKASREMQVFPEFLQKSELPIERDSVENRTPPEPDILCRHKEQGFTAFELVELCDPEIARTTAEVVRSGHTEPVFMWTADPGRLVTHDDAIILIVQHIIELRGLGMFRRVWLLGEEACQIISERLI